MKAEESARPVQISITGDTPSAIAVKGTPSVSTNGEVVMLTGATHCSTTPSSNYDGTTALTESGASVTTIPPNETRNIYFLLKADLTPGHTSLRSDATQRVTFTSSC